MGMTFKPGTQVDLMLYGEWEGPFTVTAREGRTPDHLVLRAEDGVLFESYNDAPHNTRPHEEKEQ